jgi:hypothetical protein
MKSFFGRLCADAAQKAECHVIFTRLEEFFSGNPAMLGRVHSVYAVFLKGLGDLGLKEKLDVAIHTPDSATAGDEIDNYIWKEIMKWVRVWHSALQV